MKRLLIVAVVGLFALSVASPGMATHGPTFTASGTVAVGHPATNVTGGITENLGSCDPESGFNGLDGRWYDITGFGDHTATLTLDANSDFDAYWYDASCTFIDDSGMAQGFVGETETAPVPTNAKFVIVDLFLGANGTFTLKIA